MHRFLGLGLVSGLFGASLLVACGPSVESTSLFGSSGGVSTGGAGGSGAGDTGQGGAVTSSGSAMGGGGASSSASSTSASASSSSSTSASASASSSTSASSGTGGFDPQACGQCSFNNCQAEIFACGQPCQSFVQCAQNCADQACIDACLAQYPQAKPTYDCTCAACTADCGSFCPSGGASSSASSGTGGGGACASCGQLLQGSQDPPCMGSDKLAQDLLTCTCQVNCTGPCANSCNGGQPDQTCFTCVQGKCGTQLNACLND